MPEDIKQQILLAASERSSDEWFVLGERLSAACKRVGSATHCLHEWAEPTDAVADVDEHPRRGRRNTYDWQRSSPEN
jgi:hypothetical protein